MLKFKILQKDDFKEEESLMLDKMHKERILNEIKN